MKTLILGIGNEIRRDDAVGLIVAREIFNRIDEGDIELEEASSGGLPLLSKIEGFDRVFLVDSVITTEGQPGDWYFLSLEDLEGETDRIASHSVDLKTMLEMGKELGEPMPEIWIFAIEVKEPHEFGKNLSEEVKEVLPGVISEIVKSIEEEI